MAGITAASASKVFGAGDTSANASASGFVTGERITLATSPAGSAYSWGLAIAQGSAEARSALTATDAAAPSFMADVGGYYTVTCTVDGATFYALRISVTKTAIASSQEAIRLQPKTDASIPAPAVGVALYYSSTQSALAIKLPDGSVKTVNTTAV